MNTPLFPPIDASDKATLRRILRQRRITQNPLQRTQAEKRANNWLKTQIKRNKHIGIYWAIGSEIHLTQFICAAHQRGAKLHLPYIERGKRQLWFTPFPKQIRTIRSSKLKPHKKTTQIPQFNGKKIRADRLHTLILPLIGIDQCGNRLGQGGGFYDATLTACKHKRLPKTIAFAFSCQTLAQLPAETHDFCVHELICEHGRIVFKQSKTSQETQ
ncbi:MAG: 5-formyltetrahydrofolate cyclo-ligase [Alysiella sp.]|uniref:5-formyltetrahydrofolate cyclo-ligase n=1 Tax=Alysiella sp. TaxID=1872483 RepID=UPI0026DC5889|nr:5-formyltetrahydrofolate cyclo-ligase [Alysiella sp.]MDO4433867.1 5-formyltetrahydrofolate cyclo-ligase [Alysiella sp.]